MKIEKKKFFIWGSAVLFLLLISAMGVFLYLTSEYALKKHLLGTIARKTDTEIRVKNISLHLFSPENTLRLSQLEIKKNSDTQKGDFIFLRAENMRLQFYSLSPFQLKGNGIKTLFIDSLTVKAQKKGKLYEREFTNFTLNDLKAGSEAAFSFLTQLPLTAGKLEQKPLVVAGNGNIQFDQDFKFRNGTLLLKNREDDPPFRLALSAKKDETALWGFKMELKGSHISSGELFHFLHLEKWKEDKITFKNISSHFSANHKSASDLFSKTLSGKLSVTLAPSSFSFRKRLSDKNKSFLVSSVPFLQMALQNYIRSGKKTASQNKTDAGRVRAYQEKLDFLKKLSTGKTAFPLNQGELELEVNHDLCLIKKCIFSGIVPDKGELKGAFTLSDGKLKSVTLHARILELFIPVYFNGGTIQAPAVDREKTLKQLWKNNKKLLLEKGIQKLQKKVGSQITIDGKKLSDMSEKEAVEKAEKFVESKLDSLFKRLERRKKRRKNR